MQAAGDGFGRRQRWPDYSSINAEAEAQEARIRQLSNDHEKERAREQRFSEPAPHLSPMLFSYRWLQNRIRNFWQKSRPGVRTVTTLAAITTTWIIIIYSYQFIFGWLFYTYAYYKAYNGYDYPMSGCHREIRNGRSFWTWSQSHQEWFQLQRCRAYEAGGDRDGQLSPFGQIIATLITDPFDSSPGIYLVALFLVVYFVLPPLGRRIRAWSNYVWHAERPFWGRMIYIGFCTSILLLMANDCNVIAFLVVLGFAGLIAVYVTLDTFVFQRWRTAWDTASENVFAGPIIVLFSFLWSVFPHTVKLWKNEPPPGPRYHCIHVETCHCFTERDRSIRGLGDEITALKTHLQVARENLATQKQLLAIADTNLALVTAERDRLDARNNGPLPSPGHWHNARSDGARSKHWEAQFIARDAEYAQLHREKEEQERQFRRELERLQRNVDYTTGVGLDREIAMKELYDAKATIRNLERERSALSLAGMTLRQQLAREKESHTEKCQNEAGCQRRIRELGEKYDRIVAHMREDQHLVTDACIRLGMDPKEAEHMQLRAYLAEVTIKLAQLYALGTRGADTTDLQVDIMRKEVAREATYKNRLERELVRLGGNILDVRVGLDTTRPQDWKIDFMTYEQNHLRVFPIYLRLWQAINDMTEVYSREGFLLPSWYHQPVRNDMTTHARPLPSTEAAMQLIGANALTNPHIQNLDILIEKLVVSECQRLYNRGIQLLSFLDSNMTVHAIIPGIQGVNAILNEVLHEVLDFLPALLKDHSTERRLSPRKEKKFQIYSAMQYTIASLVGHIIANKRHPPEWLSTRHLDELFSKVYDTPENLAMNLCNHELAILAKRIQQLVAFTEEYHLPGTKAGPPRFRLQHNAKYKEHWTGLVIARTFAELTISHWNAHKAQKETLVTDNVVPKTPHFETEPQLLPLDIEKFRQAVGLLPSKTEDNRWPDDWKATMVVDPSSGPAIIFEPPGRPDQNPKATGLRNDDSQGAPTGTAKEMERKSLQNQWYEHHERCEQLYNHVVGYGIKNNIPSLRTTPLRTNADAKTMKRDIETFKELQSMYVGALTGGKHKFQVPPMRKNGGKMEPYT